MSYTPRTDAIDHTASPSIWRTHSVLLERALATAQADAKTGWEAATRFKDERDKANARIAELEKARAEDAKRLDWMESRPFMAYRDRDPESHALDNHFTFVDEDAGRTQGRRGITKPTLRQAIDAAMSSTQPTHPYRNMEIGEVIQEGDECRQLKSSNADWKKSTAIGSKVIYAGSFRRPTQPTQP